MHRRNFLKLTGVGGLIIASESLLGKNPTTFIEHQLQLALSKTGSESVENFISTSANYFIQDLPVLLKSSEYKNIRLDKKIIRPILFRGWYADYLEELLVKFTSRYGPMQSYYYTIVISKLLQGFWESKNNMNSLNEVCVPTLKFFDELLNEKTGYSWTDLYNYCKQKDIDRKYVDQLLIQRKQELMPSGEQDFEKYGFMYKPWNKVRESLSKKGVGVYSSLLRYKENGESMNALRTGLELKVSVFNKLMKFVDLFRNDFDGTRAGLTICGAKELNHHYDKKLKLISHTHVGAPLHRSDGVLNLSHELGNCVDFRVDGLLLLDWMMKHSTPYKTADLERIFNYGGVSFRFAYHGDEPLGGHIHCRMN